jgi:hypothetical protein
MDAESSGFGPQFFAARRVGDGGVNLGRGAVAADGRLCW